MNCVNVDNIHNKITVASFTYVIRVIINRLDFSIVQKSQSMQNCFFFYTEFMSNKPSQYKDWPIRLKCKMHKFIVLKKSLQMQKTTSKS